MARLINAGQVAAMLGVSIDTWYRERRRLAEAGFPPPVAPFRHRWSETAVAAWIDRGPAGPAPAHAAAPGARPADDDVAAWSAILDQRAGASL